MLNFLAMTLAVLFWVQPVMAHDSPEEIAAQAAAEKKQQLEYERQQQRRGVELKHELFQEYVKWINQWNVRLQIFPQSHDSGMSKVRLLVRNQYNKTPQLSNVSLFLMKSGKKIVMIKEDDHFKAVLRLPKSRQSILMVKMKDQHGKIYFAKFQH